jgi:hypothetical protein
MERLHHEAHTQIEKEKSIKNILVYLYPAPSIMHDKHFSKAAQAISRHAQEPRAVSGWKRWGITLGSYLGVFNVMWLFIGAF